MYKQLKKNIHFIKFLSQIYRMPWSTQQYSLSIFLCSLKNSCDLQNLPNPIRSKQSWGRLRERGRPESSSRLYIRLARSVLFARLWFLSVQLGWFNLKRIDDTRTKVALKALDNQKHSKMTNKSPCPISFRPKIMKYRRRDSGVKSGV